MRNLVWSSQLNLSCFVIHRQLLPSHSPEIPCRPSKGVSSERLRLVKWFISHRLHTGACVNLVLLTYLLILKHAWVKSEQHTELRTCICEPRTCTDQPQTNQHECALNKREWAQKKGMKEPQTRYNVETVSCCYQASPLEWSTVSTAALRSSYITKLILHIHVSISTHILVNGIQPFQHFDDEYWWQPHFIRSLNKRRCARTAYK